MRPPACVYRRAVAALAVLAGLAGCAPTPQAPAPEPVAQPVLVSTAPRRRPDLPGPTQAELRRARAAAARAAAAASQPAAAPGVLPGYFERIEHNLASRGLLSGDRHEATPMTPEQLTEDFVHIALRDEYTRLGAPSAGASAPAAALRRWPGEVRMQVVFGPSVPAETRVRDRQSVAALAERLSRASGHPVRQVGEGGNFVVAVTSAAESPLVATEVARLIPGLPPGDVAALGQITPQTFCTAFSYGQGGTGGYAYAVAMIRAELPPRLRSACFEEELAQGLGLPNDSPAAQPSIFNDDEKHAVLTQHDELLLKILYDPRLRPGMLEAEARPIVAQIAAELLGAPAPAGVPVPVPVPSPTPVPALPAAPTSVPIASTPALPGGAAAATVVPAVAPAPQP